VALVADIDHGGAFAALLGTWEWLSPAERSLVRGFVLNKFRGDASLLEPAPTLLEQRTGVPVIGVVPYLEDLVLPEENAASLTERRPRTAWLEIAVVRLPHLANFDEFAAVAAEPGVHLRWVTTPHELRASDLVILPGSKATHPRPTVATPAPHWGARSLARHVWHPGARHLRRLPDAGQLGA